MNPLETLPGMNRDDADVSFSFVMKYATRYSAPVNDPMFSAHKPLVITELGMGEPRNITMYQSDNPMTGVACAQQVITLPGSLVPTFRIDHVSTNFAQLRRMVTFAHRCVAFL